MTKQPVAVVVDPLPALSSFSCNMARAYEGFAGSARWAAAVRRLGIETSAHDIKQCDKLDFTSPTYIQWLKNVLLAAGVEYVHLGIECKTLSQACKPAVRIATPEEIRGRKEHFQRTSKPRLPGLH